MKGLVHQSGGNYGTALQSDVRNTKTLGLKTGIVAGTLNLSNVVPTNIKKNVVIDGVTGVYNEMTFSPGNNLQFRCVDINHQGAGMYGTAYTKKEEVTIGFSGIFRISFKVGSDSGVEAGYGRIYKNGVAYGIERTFIGYVGTFTEDLAFSAGDKVQTYTRTRNGPGTYGVYCLDLQILTAEPSIFFMNS